MSFPKPTPEAKEAFDTWLPPDSRVKVKPMFGNLAAFVDDHMFMGVFGDHVFLRLSEADRSELVASTGAAIFEPMAGRPMKEYVLLPEEWRETREAAHPWVMRSLAWVGSMPPKPEKPKKAKKV